MLKRVASIKLFPSRVSESSLVLFFLLGSQQQFSEAMRVVERAIRLVQDVVFSPAEESTAMLRRLRGQLSRALLVAEVVDGILAGLKRHQNQVAEQLSSRCFFTGCSPTKPSYTSIPARTLHALGQSDQYLLTIRPSAVPS